jgi:homogentisate 1,2-dioxygenase
MAAYFGQVEIEEDQVQALAIVAQAKDRLQRFGSIAGDVDIQVAVELREYFFEESDVGRIIFDDQDVENFRQTHRLHLDAGFGRMCLIQVKISDYLVTPQASGVRLSASTNMP